MMVVLAMSFVAGGVASLSSPKSFGGVFMIAVGVIILIFVWVVENYE